MKNNNKGFTMIEILVVIAIIAILLGVIVTSLSLVYSGDARKAANTFVAFMNEARVETMSGTVSDPVEFKQNGNDFEVSFVKNGNTKTDILADRSIEVTYNTTESFSNMEFTFDKGTGKITEITVDGTPIDPVDFDTVEFTAGGRTFEVTVYTGTGYFELLG